MEPKHHEEPGAAQLPQQPPPMDRILRLAQVAEIAQMEKTTIMRLVRAGKFPPPVQIGERAVGWRASDLQNWLANLQPAQQ